MTKLTITTTKGGTTKPMSGVYYFDGQQEKWHVSGTRILDSAGNKVYIKGINAHTQERHTAYWTEADIIQMKKLGVNLLRIQMETIGMWMPIRKVPDESYFINNLDREVAWCEKHGLNYEINMRQLMSGGTTAGDDYKRQIPAFPNWLWQGLYDSSYTYPLTVTQAEQVLSDFFNYGVSKQQINRKAYADLWAWVAKRYLNNKNLIGFGFFNEPFIGSRDVYDHEVVGRGYTRLMEETVDAVKSVNPDALFFIEYARYMNKYKCNRSNVITEAHAYINGAGATLQSFQAEVDKYISTFSSWGQPIFFGEMGFYDPPKPNDWQTKLQGEVAYLDSIPICCGRLWFDWGWFYGEARQVLYPTAYYNQTETQQVWDILFG